MKPIAAVLATAGVALLASACGGGPKEGRVARLGPAPTPAASAQVSDALAFSRCMRSHGVSSFPDPASGGTIPKESLQQLGVSSSRFQTAESACGHLLPKGGRPPDQAERRRVRAQSLSFARCVRAHGVPSFPDPDSSGRIPDPATVGIDQGSPRFEAANQACGRYRPPYLPSNSAYNAWARTHTSGSG